jgi:cell wall assembly regulator SMI1
VPFPVDEERVVAAEDALGRRLPDELRQRLMRDNGGDAEAVPSGEGAQRDFDPHWELHAVWDDSDRKRAARSANHIVRETAEARGWAAFPEDAIAIASNGTGDRLILQRGSDEFAHWDHETGAVQGVEVSWE